MTLLGLFNTLAERSFKPHGNGKQLSLPDEHDVSYPIDHVNAYDPSKVTFQFTTKAQTQALFEN
jgi:hypothetical protein